MACSCGKDEGSQGLSWSDKSDGFFMMVNNHGWLENPPFLVWCWQVLFEMLAKVYFEDEKWRMLDVKIGELGSRLYTGSNDKDGCSQNVKGDPLIVNLESC